MAVIAVLLPMSAVVIGYLLWGEVRKHRSGQQLVSPRRFRLRVTAGALSLAVCAVMYSMLFVLPKSFLESHPVAGLALGVFCLASAVALILIMLADVQEVEDRLKEREGEVWRDFARSLTSQDCPHDERQDRDETKS